MIYESNPITLDEKGELVAIMNGSAMRVAVTEVLQEINSNEHSHLLNHTFSSLFVIVLILSCRLSFKFI